jgi:hypothetical protein
MQIAARTLARLGSAMSRPWAGAGRSGGLTTRVLSANARRAIVMSVLLLLTACCYATTSYASPCPLANNDHCYALDEWNMPGAERVEGQYAGVTISQASVPGATGGDRINNEMWTSFGPYWIEDGIYVGHEYGNIEPKGRTSSTEPTWFYALNYNSGGKEIYAERDYTYGPSVGTEWWIYHLSTGSNVWCVYFDNSEAACYGPSGFETDSKRIEEGLEDYYIEKAPVNNGIMIGEGQWTDGSWHNWNAQTYQASSGFCAEKPGGGDYGLGSLAWSTSSCGGGDALLGSGAPSKGPASVHASDGQLPAVIDGAAPAQPLYTTPSGPAMSSSELMSVAKRVAAEAGDASATLAGAMKTGLGMMTASVSPYIAPSGSSSAASYDASEVEWVELHGAFDLQHSTVPQGQKSPTGTVLDLAIDTHTGHVDMITVSQEAKTAQMENLGAVTK